MRTFHEPRHRAAAALLFAGLRLAATGVLPAPAQVPDEQREVVEAAVALYNAAATTRLSGEARIAEDAEVLGDVAALGGPVVLAGAVRGDIAVINGDLVLVPGARVTGDVRVVGGRIRGRDGASLGGRVVEVSEPVSFRREGDRIVLQPPGRSPLTTGRRFAFGETRFGIGLHGSYNRVEGVPIGFGPRLELGRSNPTVLDGQLIYRTQSGIGFRPSEMGYLVRLEQYVGGHRSARVGFAARSEIEPIETSGVSDAETSLSTFVLHQDYRDYYEREGWSAYLTLTGRARPWELTVEYRDENHRRRVPQEPWSLRYNDEPWRPQPVVGQGRLRSVATHVELDTRNDRLEPSAGWLLAFTVEQGVGGELGLLQPDPLLPPGSPLVVQGVDEEFTAFELDARRYVRLDPRQRVALRLYSAGSVNGNALPPQRQRTLGGEGLLPGYPIHRFDCGARAATVQVDGEPFYPYYGCDRVALAQLQYSLAFPIVPGIGRRLGLGVDFGDSAELVLFGDAGRAWTEEKAVGMRTLGEAGVRADVGLGFALGRLGIYWAVPLSGPETGVNFFLRLAPRI